MAAATEGFPSQVRKLRKKLRQIENLERSTRELTEEETLKVERKIEIRGSLLDLIAEHGDITQTSELSRETTQNSFQSSGEYDSVATSDINLDDENEENFNTNSNSVIYEKEGSDNLESVVEACADSAHQLTVNLRKPDNAASKPNLPVPKPVLSSSKVVLSLTRDRRGDYSRRQSVKTCVSSKPKVFSAVRARSLESVVD